MNDVRHSADTPREPLLLQREPGAVGTDSIAHAQYHYNPSRDVVFQGEFLPEGRFKVHAEDIRLQGCAWVCNPFILHSKSYKFGVLLV